MQPNWGYVKKTTLWQFEDLIKKFKVIRSYPVVWKAYNQDMTQATVFARRIFPENDGKPNQFPAKIVQTIECLKSEGISNWETLLSNIPSKAKCEEFTREHNILFEEFIDLLNYLLRWGFPFQTATRELLEHENSQELINYARLKRHKLMNSFDILEGGHTKEGRRNLAELTGLPMKFITDLAHRADIARLPYVRRKTMLPLVGAGYNTLNKIASGDPAQMESNLDTYFKDQKGKSWENYKSVIVIKLLVTCAKALPVIMEE
jgi:hypothetical protein